jgi:hypothetical protein
MKIVFLDFDGVIVTTATSYERIDMKVMPHVCRIIEETNAKVVISSAWRNYHDLEYLTDMLVKAGLHKEDVVSETPYRDGVRGREISLWLERSDVEIESFVILDDDVFDMKEHEGKYVQTDTDNGITSEEADEAIKILDKDIK